jgi:hypothetical protein
MLDVQAVRTDLPHGPGPNSDDRLDEVVLAPDLDRRRVHEDVDELGPEPVADGERLVVDRDKAVGADASKDPLIDATSVRYANRLKGSPRCRLSPQSSFDTKNWTSVSTNQRSPSVGC